MLIADGDVSHRNLSMALAYADPAGLPELLPKSPFEMACVFTLFSKLQRVSVLLLKAENARFVSTRPNSYRRTDWYEHE